MAKKGVVGIISALLVLGVASTAFAAEEAGISSGFLWAFFGVALACGLGIGLAALGTGLGMGNAINGGLQGTARNPEASGKIMTTMIIGLALIESLCIYALVICFMLLGKIPDLAGMFETVMKGIGA